MKQTKLVSLIEAIINTFVGFWVSFFAWPIAAKLADMDYSPTQHVIVIGFFTALSVARGYIIRRWFNSKFHAFSLWVSSLFSNPIDMNLKTFNRRQQDKLTFVEESGEPCLVQGFRINNGYVDILDFSGNHLGAELKQFLLVVGVSNTVPLDYLKLELNELCDRYMMLTRYPKLLT